MKRYFLPANLITGVLFLNWKMKTVHDGQKSHQICVMMQRKMPVYHHRPRHINHMNMTIVYGKILKQCFRDFYDSSTETSVTPIERYSLKQLIFKISVG